MKYVQLHKETLFKDGVCILTACIHVYKKTNHSMYMMMQVFIIVFYRLFFFTRNDGSEME